MAQPQPQSADSPGDSSPMPGSQIMSYPTKGWQKFAFKAPLVLWRLGLGPLLGRYLVLITHTGRKSGLPRHTMTEYHRLDGLKIVPCAFGERAQWYKNIQADPHVTIQTSDGAESVRARRITEDVELLAAVRAIQQHNPVMFEWYLDSVGVTTEIDDILAHKDALYLLIFEPTDVPTPPPLEADLKWVWGVVGGIVAINVLANLFGRRKD